MVQSKQGTAMVVLGLVVLAGLGGGLWWWASSPHTDSEPAAATSAPSSTAKSPERAAEPALPADPARDRWRSKRDRVHATRALRVAALRAERAPSDDPAPAADACAEGCQGTLKLQLRLAEAASGCRERLDEDAVGKARFVAHVIAEPDAGAVVDAVDVLEDTIASEAFTECMVESATLAALADPTQPVADTFAFRYTAGPKGDNAVDFLSDHPELAERYPALQAILDRPPDAPSSDEEATHFARIVSTDQQALAAFTQWTQDQGLDLSSVRTD